MAYALLPNKTQATYTKLDQRNIRFIQLSSGEVPKRKNKSIKKDEAIKNTLNSFDARFVKEYLINMSNNLY